MYRLKYTLLQTLYWCSAAVIFCFAASFLQGCGFTNAETGLIVALGNLFGLLASVLLGSWLDRSQCDPFRPALLILALYIAASVALILQSGNNILTGLCFVLCFGCNLVLNPVYIRVAGLIQSGDPGFRFSVPRGAGSLAFALTAWATGLLVQAASVSSLPPAMACTAFLQIPVLFSLRGVSQSSVLSGIEPVRGASLRTFLRRMPRFALLLLGITLIFAANNTVNNFLINVVHNAGGTYADLGRLTFFSSVVEFPAMLFYSRQNPRRQKNCLRFSLLFFPVKLIAISLAGSVPQLFLAFLFHSLSFGLYTPAIVDYVDRTVRAEDTAKGQSLTASVASLGTMAATLTSGFLLDRLPLQTVLLVLGATAALGAALGLIASRAPGTER